MSDALKGRRAVFLDRDGVVNVYLPGDYVKSPAELVLLPGAAAAVGALCRAGWPVFLISNQQGVAKGLMTETDLIEVDHRLRDGIAAAGGEIAQSYYCTHPSQERCECRKPKGGMLLRAAREHGLDLETSVFIGDTETDAAAAHAAGVGTFILVRSGKFRDRPMAGADTALFPIPPTWIADDLQDAVQRLIALPEASAVNSR